MDKGHGGNPLDQIWERIYALEDQVGSIECGNKSDTLAVPAYDSGWVSTEGGTITFSHNLGTTEVLVYLIGNDTSGALGIHQFQYGEMYWAYWHNLDANSIEVTAYPPWDYVRVILWKIQEPPT